MKTKVFGWGRAIIALLSVLLFLFLNRADLGIKY